MSVIELSGGSLSLPSSATVTRYFPGTEIVRFRHFIDYEPKEGCSLITGSLNPTEIIARIRKPDVEFTYTRYTEDSIPIRQMSVDGKWYDEAEWQDRAAMLAPRENRSETILTNGGGFGSGVREIRPYLLGAGVILIGAGFVFFFRRRNVA